MRDCEVVIVGCGPSGNTLAYRLARQGREVLLLEKETLPRVKVCGGVLSRKTLTEIPYSVEEVVEGKVGDVLLARGSEHVVDRSLPEVGVTVRREALDHFMARKAVEVGAGLEHGCRFERYEEAADGLRVKTTRGELRAKVLVGADGAYSTVRRQLYPCAKLRIVPAIEALVSPRESALDALGQRVLFDLGGIRGGYAWIFPKKDHLNVGLYRFLKTRNNRDLKRRLLEWIGDNPLLREHRGLEIRAHSIPLRPVAERLSSANVLLVGDAAGLAEALFGEGIHHAVRSAHLAAEAVIGFLAGRNALSEYDRLLRPLRRDLGFARATASLFYRLPHSTSFRMSRSRIASHFFSGLMTGRVSPGQCFFYTAGLVPMWLLEPETPPCTMVSALQGP